MGFLSTRNDEPLRNLHGAGPASRVYLVSKTDTEIVLSSNQTQHQTNAKYLGVLALEDSSQVFWVNDSAPLP